VFERNPTVLTLPQLQTPGIQTEDGKCQMSQVSFKNTVHILYHPYDWPEEDIQGQHLEH
jgi:hypothetical protein